ncbi:MAG: IclR family transcriptional regulator domain-containing protein, partial [Gaiella sp.]
ERVRKLGYAEAYEEREPGLNAVAAPVWSSTGVLAAIVALQGPSVRFGRAEVRAALPPLVDHCRQISFGLGWGD